MKKNILIFAITVFLMCGTACAERNISDIEPQNSSEESSTEESSAPESKPGAAGAVITDSSSQQSTSEVTENPASTPAASFDGLALDGYEFAVAYVGYVEKADVNSVREFAAKSPVAAKYPFIADIANDRIILAGGGEIYCVIPAKTDAKITVNSLDHDENGAEILGDELFSGDGAPILISCNVSDIMPNAAVSITNGDKTLKFTPFISLRDGRLDLPENMKILDFSEYGF